MKKQHILGVIAVALILIAGGTVMVGSGVLPKNDEEGEKMIPNVNGVPGDWNEISKSLRNLFPNQEKSGVPAQDQKETTDDPQMAKQIDFAALQAQNPDVYAYIEIPDTQISYPVLQSGQDRDVDYYLDTNLDGSSGYPGSIYSQNVNSKDFTDRNTILYGHDMLDGSMFANLHYYEDKTFLDTHPYVYVYLPNKTLRYRVLEVVTYNDELLPYKYNNFPDDASVTAFLNDTKNAQYGTNMQADGVTAEAKDKLLTMSTCIASMPDNRLLVVSKLDATK